MKHRFSPRFFVASSAVFSFLLPVISEAQQIKTIGALAKRIVDVLNLIFPVVMGLAVLFILIGLVNYIIHGDQEEKRREGRSYIIWGILSLFIMTSIWGLVNILAGSLPLANRLEESQIPLVPQLPR